MAQGQQLSAREQARLGLPDGWKKRSILPFAGMNLSDSRLSIGDAEFAWLENWVRIGAGRLQASFDIGPDLFNASGGRTILTFQFFTLNTVDYVIVFYTDGTADQLNILSGAVIPVATTATFGQNPDTAQWGTQYLLIADNAFQNHYWAWDGAVLYGAGSIAPNVTLTAAGSGYTSQPLIVAFGGSGSGATFSAVLFQGSVVNVVVTDPGTGYQPGDIVQLQFIGGGSDTGAQLQSVISGQAILSIEPVSLGSGYTSNPTVAITGGGGSVPPQVTAVIGSGSQAGQIVQYILVTPGSADWTGTPTITVTGGGGTGATAVADMTSAVVTAVNVIDGGTGYQGSPGLTFAGGGGSGATAVAIMNGGSIVSVQVINGGQDYTSPPAVIVAPGINDAAAATVELMPYGVSGDGIATYLSRVELVNPFTPPGLATSNWGTKLISAPGSFTDFAASDGGLTQPSTESELRAKYTGLQISGGYLYYFGDTSISVLSQITTGGSPTVTTLNYQTLDTQSGTSWGKTIQSVGRDLIFANQTGIWRLYGGTPTKLSEKIDPLFTAALLLSSGAVTPSAAVTTFMSRRIYLLNILTVDLRTNKPRQLLIGLDEGQWHVFSQSIDFTFIGTYQRGSYPQAYGTDGKAIYPIMASTSSTLVKSLSSKQWGVELSEIEREAHAFFLQMEGPAGSGPIPINITIETEDAAFPLPAGVAQPDGALVFGATGDIVGSEIGFSLTTTVNDAQLLDFGLAAIDVGAVAANM